jgi:uncharacterized membrane protein
VSHSTDLTGTPGLEVAVGRVLRIGVSASSMCLGVGLTLALGRVATELARPLLTTGLMLLLATPAARVIVSAIDYAREHDWLFVALTLIVVLELAASVAAAVYGVRL